MLKDAINDGNVLGFSVDYYKTIDANLDNIDYVEVEGINTEEAYMADERINNITEGILTMHPLKTNDMTYTSIFATASIPQLVKYYDCFKTKKTDLKIAAIFTYGPNEDYEGKDELSCQSLERIINDYNKMFDTNYSVNTFDGYFKDVSKRVKNAEIDILIVVNMFLTGFDSKKLNTLYVDKALKYHLDQKQEVDLEKEYGIEHLVDSLEGDFYTFDMFYQSQEHYQTMVEIFKEDLIINDHGGMGSCDCSTIEFDKGSAIAYLLDYFHIDKDNAYAFGDGYNDQAMFREVGHGIAMGNAVDVLKEKATYITDNFDQEGILKALYHEKVLDEK